MFLLRAAMLAVSVFTLVLGVCESSDNTTAIHDTQVKALKAAMAHQGDDPNNAPNIGESFDCVITPRRIPSTPEPTLMPVRGACIWTVAAQGDNWTVTFNESWLCKDWAAKVANYPDCDGTTGYHEWQYLVNLTAGTVDPLSDRGQFAPDM